MTSLMKQIADAQKQIKLMAKTYGRASQQYQDAIKHQSNLVIKQMQGAK